MSCNSPTLKNETIVLPFNSFLVVRIEKGHSLLHGTLHSFNSNIPIGRALHAPTFRQILGLMYERAEAEQNINDNYGCGY